MTIGGRLVDLGMMMKSNNRPIDIWDTAGQERFQSMHPSYYHQAHACLLVFDVTRKITYKNLSNWLTELRKYRPEIPCFCIANKIDGRRRWRVAF